MNSAKIREYYNRPGYGPALESDNKVRKWLEARGHKFTHFIDGHFEPPYAGDYREVINPATGEALTAVAQGSATDVELAVRAAEKAFPSWSGLSGGKRANWLYAIARAIAKNPRPFAVLESLNNGKPIRETRDIDVPLAIRHFLYHAGWAEVHGDEYPGLTPGGVVGQIIPWNFPLLMLAWKIAPAIAAGNTVVLKPSETTPLTALMFAEMLEREVGLPPGVVNIVTGDGATGELIVKHEVPWKIAFTGSTEVGRSIRLATADTEKELTLELGGKSPFIVAEDADFESAAEGIVDAIWLNQGQVCCAGSRLLVQESIYSYFVQKLKERAEKLIVGSPLDKNTDIGAINSAKQLATITELVARGELEGATKWQPENRACPIKGFYFRPTIFTDVSPANTIAREEIFGPVLVCMSYRTTAEAIQLANNTRYGLAASVWSENINRAPHLAKKIKAGTVWINSTNLFDAASGFGGYRESGFGREGGREGILGYLKEKPVDPVIDPVDDSGMSMDSPESSGQRMDRTFRFLIGGKLARPDGGASFKVFSHGGKLLGLAGDANRKDARNAVEAARNAADAWEDQAQHLRAQLLYFLAENLDKEKGRFALAIARQTGRSIYGGASEVGLAVDRLRFYAAMADKYEGTIQSVPGRMIVMACKEPIGVIGVRAPDEFPLLGLVSTLAPAFVMGNSIILVAGKHALTAGDFIQLIQTSDVPASAVNILTAADPDAIVETIAKHEDVDAVWHFGSREGSVAVKKASVGNMKRTWCSPGAFLDWAGSQGKSQRFLREATQVKNIWTPYGV